jgi:hypothetical protein
MLVLLRLQHLMTLRSAARLSWGLRVCCCLVYGHISCCGTLRPWWEAWQLPLLCELLPLAGWLLLQQCAHQQWHLCVLLRWLAGSWHCCRRR